MQQELDHAKAQLFVPWLLARSAPTLRVLSTVTKGYSYPQLTGFKSAKALGQDSTGANTVIANRITSDLLRYLQNNVDSLPNYGQRWRNGQRISSAFVESAVNQIIDKRMSKSQQMRWDPKSAHQLLQVRVRVIDGPAA